MRSLPRSLRCKAPMQLSSMTLTHPLWMFISQSEPIEPETRVMKKRQVVNRNALRMLLTGTLVALRTHAPQDVAAMIALRHAEILVCHEVMAFGSELLQRNRQTNIRRSATKMRRCRVFTLLGYHAPCRRVANPQSNTRIAIDNNINNKEMWNKEEIKKKRKRTFLFLLRNLDLIDFSFVTNVGHLSI